MKSVTRPNGVTLQYDDTIAVGDMITTYHKGLFVVTEIVPRADATPLFVYKKVFDAFHRPAKKGKVDECDASYCRKAKKHLEITLKDRLREVAQIQELLSQL